MHETGAVVLSSIPAEVAQLASVDMSTLPRIIASPDAVVRDSATGEAHVIVKAKPSVHLWRLEACSPSWGEDGSR